MNPRIAVRSSLLLAILLCCAPLSHANDASKRAKAEQLFTLMHMEKTYGQLMNQALAQSDQMVNQILPEGTQTDEQKSQVAALKSKVTALLTESMSWTVLEPDYVKLYADNYTEEDLDGIIVFYRSPVGQKMLDKTPELLKESTAIAAAHMKTVYPQMTKMLEDFGQQMKSEQGPKN